MDKKQEVIEYLRFLALNDSVFAYKVAYFKIDLQKVLDALDDNKTLDDVTLEKKFTDSYDKGFGFAEF